jgi:hypothetical protein
MHYSSPALPPIVDFSRFLAGLEVEERERRGIALRRTVAELFCLADKGRSFWGFKEIWNGDAVRYDWAIYDTVFPGAHWVHIIRNPVNQVRSVVELTRHQHGDADIGNLLHSWLNVFRMSRQRAETGRYSEVLYEDIVKDPKGALASLFEQVGVGWREECSGPVARQIGLKSPKIDLPAGLQDVMGDIPGLHAVMDEFGYSAEEGTFACRMPRPLGTRLIPLGCDGWQLSGEFTAEENFCWWFDFSSTDQATRLAAIADDIDFWQRSKLRLFEDGRRLAPAHTLHCLIRQVGSGGYSHWQNGLMFSTSDNSNPNRNGRVYSFDLQG